MKSVVEMTTNYISNSDNNQLNFQVFVKPLQLIEMCFNDFIETNVFCLVLWIKLEFAVNKTVVFF